MIEAGASNALASIRTDLRRVEIVLSARIHRIELNLAATEELLAGVREALGGIDRRLALLSATIETLRGAGGPAPP
jgi:hypothetical protein